MDRSATSRCRRTAPARGGPLLFALVVLAATATLPAVGQAPFVTFSTVSPANGGYATVDTNSVAISRYNLVSAGGYQFAAYYDSGQRVRVARRALGSTSWTTYATSFAAGTISDDHDIICIGVDGDGFLHMSWGMHNDPIKYAVSTAPATTPALGALAFSQKTAVTGQNENSVTYPEFYNVPGSKDLLFLYRNGSSGSGNNYLNRYNAATKTWAQVKGPLIDGVRTSVNAYNTNLAYAPNGNLMINWTWRDTPNWQTNHDLMFAQSPDHGQTWFRQGGASQYVTPIIENTSAGGAAAQVAQVVKSLPTNKSLINQTTLAVDRNNNPLVATWYAPGWNPATGTGNPNRQYMLEYFDGAAWRSSQITNRTSDTAIDTSGAQVRDLGRPIVLVDKQNRVLVVMRFEDSGIHVGGTNYPATAPGNNLVVAYSTDLASPSPTWTLLPLDTANMGSYEPSYDPVLWAEQNKLALFYQPVGLAGQPNTTVRVLEWDAAAYFASIPEPSGVMVLAAAACAGLVRRRARGQRGARGGDTQDRSQVCNTEGHL